MKSNIIKNNSSKIKNLFLSIAATAIFNMVIQFLLYPFFERNLGKENYGVALSILSIIAIASGTIGTSANYSRMITSSNKSIDYTNGDYNVITLTLSAVCGVRCRRHTLFALPWNILVAPDTHLRSFDHHHRVQILLRRGIPNESRLFAIYAVLYGNIRGLCARYAGLSHH